MRLLFYFTVLFSFMCNAQPTKEITISYGDKIYLGEIESQTHFTISSEFGNKNLKGNKINEFVFAKPGVYKILVEEKNNHKQNECNHEHLPKAITVNVSRIKMVFDDTQLNFSEPIMQNKDTKGITMTIPVTIETYDGMPALMDFTNVHSAGIGSNIIANLDQEKKELPVGKHLLKYSLQGKVTQKSYLMFDFIDANANIQSIALQKQIDN